MKNTDERQSEQRDAQWRLDPRDAPHDDDDEGDDIQRCHSEHDARRVQFPSR
jgi:hypothetical protein